MEKNETFTAEQARNMAPFANATVETIMPLIKKQAEDGRYDLTLSGGISIALCEELEDLDYIVTKGGKNINDNDVTISWDRNASIPYSEIFKEWANSYFLSDNSHVNIMLLKAEVFEAFKKYGGYSCERITHFYFFRNLRAFCRKTAVLKLNPEHLCNKQGRLLKEGKEFIYVSTMD